MKKTESDKFPLPDPFPLPKHYSHGVESALLSKRMTKKEKQLFISEIASSMFRYKRYSDREDYTCVARAIINEYPFLKPSSGNPYVSFNIYISRMYLFYPSMIVGCYN